MKRYLFAAIVSILLFATPGNAGTTGKNAVRQGAPQPAAVTRSLNTIVNAPAFARSTALPFSSLTAVAAPSIVTGRPLILQSTYQGTTSTLRVTLHERTLVPRVITVENAASLATNSAVTMSDALTRAQTFLTANASLLRIEDPSNELVPVSTASDDLGMTHVRMKQTYQGVDVWEGDVYVHLNAQGMVSMFNGTYHPTPALASVVPTVGGDAAIATVTSMLNAQGGVTQLPPALNTIMKYSGPTARTVIWHDAQQHPHLVWLVDYRSGLDQDWNVFIDATTGAVLDKYNTVANDGPATAQAADLNGATRTVNTYLAAGTYYLLDASQPMYNAGSSSIPQNPVGAIQGLDLQNKDLSASATIYFTTSTNNQWSDASSVSAHYNAAQTYNYYRTVFGRNSIDDKGMTIYSIIHVTSNGQGMDNAFWNGSLMCYGDGNTEFKPLAGGFDVAAHEMTHGVTQNTANLTYKDQSGALNESMSDCFAAALDSGNWTIGEQVIKDFASYPTGSLRSMSDPHNGGSAGSPSWQPTSMTEFVTTTGDNGGVHTNSGIPNNAFYRVGISLGRGKASAIWYRALTKYLTSAAQFVDARIATETAAKDLYGTTSAELTAVQNAWTAVGVGSGGGTQPPVIPQLQGSSFVLVTNTDPADPNSIYMVKPVISSNADFVPLSATTVLSRPSVSDTSGVVAFVDGNHRLRALNASATPGEGYVDTNSVWESVALGPGLNSLALTSKYIDTSIYYIDFSKKLQKQIKIRTVSYDGAPAGTALYCDAMSFDPTGRYLLFDTYNQMKTAQGGDISFWNINLLDLQTLQMQSVFPPQANGIDIGNPSFAKTTGTRFVFDYVDNNAGSDKVIGADFFTGKSGPITGALSVIGYPTYSGDGQFVAYHTTASVGGTPHDAVEQIAIDATGTTPAGSAISYVVDATYPVWFVIGKRVTSVDQNSNSTLPVKTALVQNYPNPFNPTTSLDVQIATSGFARLDVFDVLGNKVATLMNEVKSPGTYTVRFDGSGLASGVYFARLQSGSAVELRKMLLMK